MNIYLLRKMSLEHDLSNLNDFMRHVFYSFILF